MFELYLHVKQVRASLEPSTPESTVSSFTRCEQHNRNLIFLVDNEEHDRLDKGLQWGDAQKRQTTWYKYTHSSKGNRVDFF